MSEAIILIVDDEEELRENLLDLLEFKGYKVAAFASGEDALANIDAVNPNLVLLDIQLPGIDGIEVLKRIRQKNTKLPVVMVSASSIRSVIAKAEENGANRTILKPYSPQEMISTVEELLLETATS